MQSINFGTGVKEYAVNDDENNTIKVDVSDFGILERYRQAINTIEQLQTEYDKDEKPTPEQLARLDAAVREQIDHIFNADISSKAFGGTNCLSVNSDGEMLFEAFLKAFVPVITQDIKAAVNKLDKRVDTAKTDKYIAQGRAALSELIS